MSTKIISLSVFFSFWFLFCVAQTGDENFLKEIKTVKTSAHINIPGTKLFLVAPGGFANSRELPSITKGDKEMIRVMDLPGESFYSNITNFNRRSFEEKGVKVLYLRELKVNGYPAKLLIADGDEGEELYNLVFGDTTFFVSTTAVFPRSDAAAKKEIQTALQSICYDTSFKIDAFAHAVFRLDDSHSRFKFAYFSSNVYRYSLNGVKKDTDDDDPFFIVYTVPAMGMMPEIVADENLVNLKQMGATVVSTDKASTGKTNGYRSYERQMVVDKDGKKMQVYQHVVLIEGTAVIMQGVSNEGGPDYLTDFQLLSNTVAGR